MILRALINFIGFQVVWFLSLFGAGTHRAWLGAIALAPFTAWHFRAVTNPRAEFALVGIACVVGFVVDTLFIQAHLLAYAEPLPFTAVAPYWILGMWVNFALTLNGSMRWLHGRYLLAAALGAIGGPVAYIAGVKLGAARLLAGEMAVYAVLALVWAVAVPLLVLATEKVNARWPLPVTDGATTG
ncbi:MAG: DUF2878 domain-containing protein [Gammaproteobacteria bacterium]